MLSKRYIPLISALALPVLGGFVGIHNPRAGNSMILLGVVLSTVGLFDLLQNKRSVLRNYPIIGRMRYLLENIRPELRQYFFESDQDEVPYSREQRALVYRRAKSVESVTPFGTLRNTQKIGHEWFNHSVAPTHMTSENFRVTVGAEACKRPYSSSVLNVSGMSYGALSPPAIEALNHAAKAGGFAQNTGEGSISHAHRKFDGDLIWQIGTGYFGCRTKNGEFDSDLFAKNSAPEQVKMIEIKLSQGAKPGHGGILPASKVTKEISEARNIPMGAACISPNLHSAFATPIELMRFLALLRERSRGKPVGMKLCVGHPWELFSIAKAISETGIHPDFITVDGAEGGTGAAPMEFADHIGAPLRDGLMLVHNTLVGLGIRDKVKIIASGKIVSAFDMARAFALGADICHMARPFMFSLGCIQARTCHTDLCPTGVATQDESRYRALSVPEKHKRAANFHANTLSALKETMEACGLHHPEDFSPHYLMIRLSSQEVRSAASHYHWLESGALKTKTDFRHPTFAKYWKNAGSNTFDFSTSAKKTRADLKAVV
ncbi:MAG: FMN-binding glutamate synthase family protein [Alphaproteobacteria bacterium]|nr:FMN-binding glutamate synthase family protein [Alphaproteobacteria bacterium]